MKIGIFEIDKQFEGEASQIGINPRYIKSFIPHTDEITHVVLEGNQFSVRIKVSFIDLYEWLVRA